MVISPVGRGSGVWFIVRRRNSEKEEKMGVSPERLFASFGVRRPWVSTGNNEENKGGFGDDFRSVWCCWLDGCFGGRRLREWGLSCVGDLVAAMVFSGGGWWRPKY
ncbi:hypothetical protein KY285_024390 [Solanum tuberosum]|nr:hypothetical protein KY285_024390 [Solanum tuberosum]